MKKNRIRAYSCRGRRQTQTTPECLPLSREVHATIADTATATKNLPKIPLTIAHKATATCTSQNVLPEFWREEIGYETPGKHKLA